MSTPTDPTAGEGLSEAERVTLNLAIDEAEECVCCGADYGSKHVYEAVERIVAAREAAARADAWDRGYLAGWEDRHEDEDNPLPAGAQHDTPNPYRADSLAPDTAGESA